MHTAAARPEAPERTRALPPRTPMEMPTALPVAPLVATAELFAEPLPGPSVSARTGPASPEVAAALAGPCRTIPMASASPVDPEVAFTGNAEGSSDCTPAQDELPTPPVPLCATAWAGPPMPIAIAVGRPTVPVVQLVSAEPIGFVTTECADPLTEIEIATVHHSAAESPATAHDEPPGT